MIKVSFLVSILGFSLAVPTGLGTYGSSGVVGLLGGSPGGGGSGIVRHAVTYTAGTPVPGAVVSPYGVNAGHWHASREVLATPVYGTVATTGYSLGGGGAHGVVGHY